MDVFKTNNNNFMKNREKGTESVILGADGKPIKKEPKIESPAIEVVEGRKLKTKEDVESAQAEREEMKEKNAERASLTDSDKKFQKEIGGLETQLQSVRAIYDRCSQLAKELVKPPAEHGIVGKLFRGAKIKEEGQIREASKTEYDVLRQSLDGQKDEIKKKAGEISGLIGRESSDNKKSTRESRRLGEYGERVNELVNAIREMTDTREFLLLDGYSEEKVSETMKIGGERCVKQSDAMDALDARGYKLKTVFRSDGSMDTESVYAKPGVDTEKLEAFYNMVYSADYFYRIIGKNFQDGEDGKGPYAENPQQKKEDERKLADIMRELGEAVAENQKLIDSTPEIKSDQKRSDRFRDLIGEAGETIDKLNALRQVLR